MQFSFCIMFAAETEKEAAGDATIVIAILVPIMVILLAASAAIYKFG